MAELLNRFGLIGSSGICGVFAIVGWLLEMAKAEELFARGVMFALYV